MYQLCDNEKLDSFICDDGRGINVEQVKEAEILKAVCVAKDCSVKAMQKCLNSSLCDRLFSIWLFLAHKYVLYVCFL